MNGFLPDAFALPDFDLDAFVAATLAEDLRHALGEGRRPLKHEDVHCALEERLHRPHQQDLLILLHLADRLADQRARAVALLLLALLRLLLRRRLKKVSQKG